ncbi:MAG TPA: hypothetical protein VER03_03205, partial [Bryobacteraceae bacterium]|nr:hypothetical protein [Bryobacteraceae bacterium]
LLWSALARHTVIGIIGPVVTILTLVAGVVRLSTRRATTAVIAMGLVGAIAFFIMTALTPFVVARCNPENRWVCDLISATAFASVVAVMFGTAHFLTRNHFDTVQATGALKEQ